MENQEVILYVLLAKVYCEPFERICRALMKKIQEHDDALGASLGFVRDGKGSHKVTFSPPQGAVHLFNTSP